MKYLLTLPFIGLLWVPFYNQAAVASVRRIWTSGARVAAISISK
jgi:hypothetical protein